MYPNSLTCSDFEIKNLKEVPKVIILFLLSIVLQIPASGQQISKPVGAFSSDSIKLGELVQYTLVHRHPNTQEVILPGATYNFAPFELVQQDFYPTVTKAGLSTDSTIYTLRTFETSSKQKLAIPVIMLQGEDTLQLLPDTSFVVLHQLVTQVQEPLILKTETVLVPVEERFDWPIFLVWILVGTFLLSLIWLLSGQTIKSKYNLYRLRKDHLYFTSRYNAHVDRYVKSGVSQSMEKAVSLWKNYLTKLERSAINSYTTKEIVEFYHDDEEVNIALRLCDKAIYGNLLTEADPETKQALTKLRRFAKSRYKLQREITKDAKNNRKHVRVV